MNHTESSMGFQEKSAWAVLVSTLVIYGVYFATTGWSGAGTGGTTLLRLVTAVVAQVAALVVIHVLFAAGSAKDAVDAGDAADAADERDTAIGLRAARNGGFVLGAGVVLAILFLVAHATLEDATGQSWWNLGPLMIAHALLACLVLAESTSCVTKVVHYRRGF